MAETPWLSDAAQAAQKYEEAVAVAAEACAEDTAGQTCYICHGEGDEDEGLVRGCACRGDNGYAHLSCLAGHAQHAGERALRGAGGPGFARWRTCGLCEQKYHGVVCCALGWACWETYMGRPETDPARVIAMGLLGNALHYAGRNEDALTIKEAHLSTLRRLGESENNILACQGKLANTYDLLGRHEEALRIERDVHAGWLRLYGEEDERTLSAGYNYVVTLIEEERFEEAKLLLRRVMPLALRVLGDSSELRLRIRWRYARVLYKDPAATLDDLREAVTAIDDLVRDSRRVVGGAHPLHGSLERDLARARAALRARDETAPPPPPPPPPPAPLYDEDELE